MIQGTATLELTSGLVLLNDATEILNTGTFIVAGEDYTDLFDKIKAGPS